MRSLIAYGKTIAVLQPLGVIQRQMDRLIVGAVLGPAAVTLVEIATQIQNGSTAILVASSYAAAPASSWVHAREEGGLLRELLVRGTKYSLLLTYPVTVGAILLSPDLVHVWVGPSYAAAAGLAALALLDTMVSAPMQVSSNILIGAGRASDVLRTAVLTVAINLCASLLLVHVMGAAGVFVGTLIALAFFVPLLGRAACRLVDLRPAELFRAAVAPALLACVPLAVAVGLVVVAPLRPLVTILLGTLLGGLVYLGVTATLVLSPAEREEIRSMFRRRRVGPADG
jgi:O-antigen/teichoic acid export membrane protein